MTSPDTELAPKSWVKPCRSKLRSPLTVLARMWLKSPEAVTSPETLLAVSTPWWLRAITSPLTVLTDRFPEVPSARTEPETVFEPGVPADPGDHAVAADRAGLDLDAGGQGDADDHRVAAAVVDGAHQVLEPALRPVQLVPDLEAAVDEADRQRVAVDLGDFDPGDGLIVGDDVEAAPDDAELERA